MLNTRHIQARIIPNCIVGNKPIEEEDDGNIETVDTDTGTVYTTHNITGYSI